MGWGCLGLPLSLGTEVFQSLSSSLAVGIPIMQVGGRVCVCGDQFSQVSFPAGGSES